MSLTPCPHEVWKLSEKRTDTMRGVDRDERDDEGEGVKVMCLGLALVAVKARVVGGVAKAGSFW